MADNEIVAGTAQPLDYDEFRSLMQRYLDEVTKHEEAATALRPRVLDGEAKVGRIEGQIAAGIPVSTTPEQLADAKARLDVMREELREHDGWVAIGLSFGLSRAWGVIISEAVKDTGWNPPPGSVLRIILPRILNLSIDLTDTRYKRTN